MRRVLRGLGARSRLLVRGLVAIAIVISFGLTACSGVMALGDGDPYQYRQPSPDGIGKVYMGREISQVMGHGSASYFERRK
jgi:hypothetical protein